MDTQDTLNRGDLQSLVTLLRDHHVRRHDIVAPTRSLTLTDEGQLDIHSQEVSMDLDRGVGTQETVTTMDLNDYAARQLLTTRLDIPHVYVKRMRAAEAGQLVAHNANHWLAESDASFLIRALQINDGTGDPEYLIRAVMSDRYKVMDDLDVTMSVLDAIRGSEHVSPEQLKLTCSRTAERMYMRIVAPDVSIEAPDITARYRDPRTGRDGREYPVVSAGVEITNSEVGAGSFSITPFAELQVCTNGMKRKQDLMRSVHIGEKLDQGIVEWSDATYEHTLALIKSKTTDAIGTFLSPGYLEQVITDMRELHVKVDEPVKTVERVTKQLRFTVGQQDDILTSFLAGGDITALGLGQAITNVALDADPDTAADMEAMAWRAMEIAAAG